MYCFSHYKRELGTQNLRRNLRHVASTYVSAYKVHEKAVSRKVRRVYEWSADILQ